MSNVNSEAAPGSSQGNPAAAAWPDLAIMALALVGSALVAVALTRGYLTGNVVFGGTRWMILGLGVVAIGLATLGKYGRAGNLAAGLRFAGIVAQVALIYLVFSSYDLESALFHDFLMPVVLTGFVANNFLPDVWRPRFFLALSLGVMFAVFGLLGGAAMLGLGLLLIGLCHLPIAMWQRVALILVVTIALGLVRAGVIPSQQLNTILPILSSIFMFRLVIYLYDIHSGKGPKSPAMRLSYFFMLPNFAFPFFPVVDFSSWGRSYRSVDEIETYQRGAMWLLIGAFHLLLYRVVNYYLAIDPHDVTGFWSFLYYAVMNFGLYLKISGLFHTILGTLFLFGFALPETHTRYYLSNSFIDFWRRINIYWKDFMQKTVFTPVFVWLKHKGVSHMRSLVAAIAAVFILTWALHAYQWFWLLGTLLFTAPDLLFWTFLGMLLIIQTVEEAKPPKPGAVARIGPKTLLVIRTVATMLTIVILWSLWSSETLGEWLSMVAVAGVPLLEASASWSVANMAASAGFIGFLFVLIAITMGYTFGLAPRGSHPRPSPLAGRGRAFPLDRIAAYCALGAGALVLTQLPQVYNQLPRAGALLAVDIGTQRLSDRDQDQLQRGYYENLTNAKMINSELWQMQEQKTVWPALSETAAVTSVDDYRRYVLRPSVAIPFKGSSLSTNSLGLRDREYTAAKPPGTIRIGILGASRAMGSGVADEQTFENIIEDSLNAAGGTPVEILNFSVGGYDMIKKAIALKEEALPLSLDVALNIASKRDLEIDPLALRNGAEFPSEALRSIAEAAGVRPDMSGDEIRSLLEPSAERLVAESYRDFAETARAAGVVPVWVFLPSTREYSEPPEIDDTLRQMAQDAGYQIIDLFDVFNGTDTQRLWLSEWDRHPNILGHKIIADRLEAELLANPTLRAMLRGD